jgi:hypothetical protein
MTPKQGSRPQPGEGQLPHVWCGLKLPHKGHRYFNEARWALTWCRGRTLMAVWKSEDPYTTPRARWR